MGGEAGETLRRTRGGSVVISYTKGSEGNTYKDDVWVPANAQTAFQIKTSLPSEPPRGGTPGEVESYLKIRRVTHINIIYYLILVLSLNKVVKSIILIYIIKPYSLK